MTSPKLSIYNKKNTASLEAVFYIDCKHNIADNIGCVFACFGGGAETCTPVLNAPIKPSTYLSCVYSRIRHARRQALPCTWFQNFR